MTSSILGISIIFKGALDNSSKIVFFNFIILVCEAINNLLRFLLVIRVLKSDMLYTSTPLTYSPLLSL